MKISCNPKKTSAVAKKNGKQNHQNVSHSSVKNVRQASTGAKPKTFQASTIGRGSSGNAIVACTNQNVTSGDAKKNAFQASVLGRGSSGNATSAYTNHKISVTSSRVSSRKRKLPASLEGYETSLVKAKKL